MFHSDIGPECDFQSFELHISNHHAQVHLLSLHFNVIGIIRSPWDIDTERDIANVRCSATKM